jgi:glycolate oxidase FAD binding subunit
MTNEMNIDGVSPSRLERPADPEAVADLLREANGTSTWVLPTGGGTAMRGGNPVDEVPIGLDMTGLDGIDDYTPADLTVSVRAGTRWSALRDELASEGQEIPIDVPFPDRATVGGVVATGYSGPRRLRDGTLKDLLLGASYVRGDGLAAKAGGMVVKNVSGFEIPRLLHGSWGSLAAITSVNLKVLPAPEHEITILADQADMLDLATRLLALTGSMSTIAAAVVDGTLDSATAAVRLTGRAAPTVELAREVRAVPGLAWREAIGAAPASASWWQEREDRLASGGDGTVSIEIGCPPAALAETLSALRAAFPNPAEVAMQASPGIGAITIAFPASSLSLDTWVRLWAEHGLGGRGRFVIADAPRDWRATRDVWFIEPGARKLMQALKQTFDPNDTLNRGRLWTSPAATLA